MTSLLNRYGSSIERDQLYSAFLLTLMGQFVVGNASYFSHSAENSLLAPTLAYGRLKLAEHPPVALGQEQVHRLHQNPSPELLENLSLNLATASGMKFLASNYRIFAPLFLKEKLVGVLFLGDKVSGQGYTTTDLEVLHSLCSVSATTFNNAILYENAKHSAREIQRLYEVRNEVINRITHEFRTPLTIIKAGVELLEKDGSHLELVSLFTESEARLENLINSLLSLSQMHSDEEDHEAHIDPLAVLHNSIHRYSAAARQKDIQFNVVQIAESTPIVLSMKENDFKTILDALFENAIKFSPASTAVTVEIDRSLDAPSIERDGLLLPDWKEQTDDLIRQYSEMETDGQSGVESEKPSRQVGNQFLVIRVSDNGIGIPERDLISVAEPFRQASNSPDLGVKGKGLGLALVHKVVSRHGGYLCCKSAEGSGTIFSVYLPIEGDAGL
jgi:signal transduction histidine kinase